MSKDLVLFLADIILYIIESHMTPEKIAEIESRTEFKLWLRRVWFKSFSEYEEMCADEELENITKKEVILRYLSEYGQK